MKKLLAIVLSAVCVLSFSACDKDNDSDSSEESAYDTVYLMNPDSMIVHREDCYTIKDKNHYRETDDLQEAFERGYRACKVCEPE